MDTNGTGLLGDARQRRLDFGLGGHYDVGQLVNDDDQVRQGVRDRVALVVKHRFIGDLAGVVGADVANARFRQDLIAPLHLTQRPAQYDRYFLWLGHDRADEVRQGFVAFELDDFRVDHDHF